LAKLPKAVNTSSEWAEEGTDLHSYISTLIDEEREPQLGDQLGDGERVLTQELLHDCIEPCLEFWRGLDRDIDEYALETEAEFPDVAGAFGTTDLAARSHRFNTTWLADWKFGVGHSVTATYPDEQDPEFEFVNEQLLFYACCLRGRFPEWFPKDVKIILSIVQPRNIDPEKRLTQTTVTNVDLDLFEDDVHVAMRLATQPAAPQKLGHWCRFAACKPLCALHNAPLLDLAAIEKAAIPRDDYGAELARILKLAPAAKALIKEAETQAHALLEAGKSVPGFKLVAMQGRRQWNTADDETIKLLRRRYKLRKADMLVPVLKSPAQIEELLPRGEKVPSSLAAMVSSGTKVVHESNKSPAIEGRNSSLKELLELALANGGNAE
jgi:hypothetical protein